MCTRPCVQKVAIHECDLHNQAVEKIRMSQGGKKGPTAESIQYNLHAVLEHSVPYLKLESTGLKQGKVLVIDPTCDVKQVRDHLKEISKNRDVLDMEDDGAK